MRQFVLPAGDRPLASPASCSPRLSPPRVPTTVILNSLAGDMRSNAYASQGAGAVERFSANSIQTPPLVTPWRTNKHGIRIAGTFIGNPD